GGKFPRFETADTDSFAGAAGASVRAGESPMIFDAGTVLFQVIEKDLEIGEIRHETLSSTGDGGTANAWNSIVDFQRAVWCEEGSDRFGIAATPGDRVTSGEIAKLVGAK